MPLSKHNRSLIQTKTGKIIIWILAILLLFFGILLVAFCLFAKPLEGADNQVGSIVLGCCAIVFGILDIVVLIRNGKKAAEDDDFDEEDAEEDVEDGK